MIAVLASSLAALAQAGAGKPMFRDIGATALPGVETTCGSRAKDYIIEVNGGGVLLEDFDRDGHVDVLIVDGSNLERIAKGEPGFPPRLFLGRGDATFAPAGEEWSMSGGRWGMGGAVGDFDGDGWPDVVVTQWGPNRVFLNRAGEGFREVTDKAGLAGDAWSTSAAALDYDRDGKLDLVVVRYLVFDPAKIGKPGTAGCQWQGHEVMCGPEGLTPVADQLYRGNGDGTFREVTGEAKFRAAPAAFGLGVMTLDFDCDGDTEIYVANDSLPNHLWDNKGDGTFAEIGFEAGVSHTADGKEQASMGIANGDWNGDGRPDLFVSNFSGESDTLYVSTRARAYRERASAAGLAGPTMRTLGWGTAFGDLDLDGDLDLYVCNGHVYPQADRPGTDTSYAQADLLLRNVGTRFALEPLSDSAPRVSRASATADLDGDGDLDIVALQVEGPVRVLRNDAPRGSHWLRVRLRARDGNTAALGARVTAEWEGGKQVAQMRTAGGYQASIPAEVHFGLGAAARLKKLRIAWPSGHEQVLEDVAVDRVLQVEEKAP